MFYEELTKSAAPVSVADMKDWLKISYSKDDTIISRLIDNCIKYGEKNTGRDFSVKSWKLHLDCFSTRIKLTRLKVDAITSIKHLVNGSLVTVSSTDYYFINNYTNTEILLVDGEDWPTDTDARERAIEIEFTTVVSVDSVVIDTGIKQHVQFMYFNRGDFDVDQAAKRSGADTTYMFDRIQRI